MPRPADPNSPTAAERMRASRSRRGLRTIGLPAPAAAALEAIRERDGDLTLAAAAARVIMDAAR